MSVSKQHWKMAQSLNVALIYTHEYPTVTLKGKENKLNFDCLGSKL